MKRLLWSILLLSCLVMVAAACSSGNQGQDPASVKVELSTEPASAVAAKPVTLTAHITGLVKENDANVQFDIRSENKNELPDLVTAGSTGGGSYAAAKTFDKPGTYTIYIHLYQGDLHVTKKKQLVVS
jgi:hypothetical protein